jgi:hypothetical protein
MNRSIGPLAVAALIVIAPATSWGCATCGCTVNSDAAMGYSTATGWRVNLEYTYIDQDELRGGTGNASTEQVVNNPSNPSLGGGEIEKDTINRYITLGVSFRPTGLEPQSVGALCRARPHDLWRAAATLYAVGVAPDQISGAHVSNLGDIKLIANYQGILPLHNFGLQLGIKLPTGQYRQRGEFLQWTQCGHAARHEPASRHGQHRHHPRGVLSPAGEPEFRRLRQWAVPIGGLAQTGSTGQRLPARQSSIRWASACVTSPIRS